MARSRSRNDNTTQPDLFSLPPLPPAQQSIPPAATMDAAVSEDISRRAVGKTPRATRRAPRQIVEIKTPHLLDVRAAAAWLGLSKTTLDKMRCYGAGPRFIRATGKAVRYDPADLAAFAEGRRQDRTSDELPA